MARLDDVRAALARTPLTLEASAGFAAVAAVLAPSERTGDLELLLLRRAEHPDDPWSGHLSFPGGGVERGEDPLAAAIREAYEEVALELPPDRVLGRLDDLATVGGRPGMVIRPFVFALDRPVPPLLPNPAEVADTLLVGLDRLLANVGRGPMEWQHGATRLTLPRVDLDGHRLWGLTLRMVDDLLHRVDGGGIGLARSGR